LGVDPKLWKAWILLGNAGIELQQFQEAQNALEKAKGLAPDEFLPYLGMAMLSEAKKDTQEAENEYVLLTEKFPDSMEGEQALLNFYRKSGQKEKLLKNGTTKCAAIAFEFKTLTGTWRDLLGSQNV